MELDQIIIDLKVKLACQQEEICLHKEKLITYDDVLIQKNELQCQLIKLKQCMEANESENELMKKNILTSIDIQTENLRLAEVAECKLRKEIKRLLNIKDCLIEKINKLEEIVRRLQIERDDLEMCKNLALDELCYTNNKLIEINCLVESLRKTLKCTEDEYCNLRCELNACKTQREKLTDACKNLNIELECKKSDVLATKIKTTQIEERFRLENETLANELEIICQKLRVMEIELNEASRTIVYNKCNMKNMEMLIMILRDISEKNRCELNLKIEKLKKELCTKKENEVCMKNQIAEFQRQNGCMVTDIKSLKQQNNENECLLEKMKHSNVMFEEIKNKMCGQLEREKNSLIENMKCQQRKIADLEHQVCCLQEKVREYELIKCRSSCDPCSFNTNSPKMCNIDVDDKILIDQLKQMYSNLE